MIDTCQANTMYSKIYSPNIIAIGSSKLGQSSYSHHADSDVGVAVIDRFTYYNLEYLESQVNESSSKKTFGDLIDGYDESKIHSSPGVRYDLYPGGEQAVRDRLLIDFFGNAQNVEIEPSRDSKSSNWLSDMQQLNKATKKKSNSSVSNNKLSAHVNGNFNNSHGSLVKRLDYKVPARIDIQQMWNDKKVGLSVLAGSLGIWVLSAWLDGRG